MVDENVFVLLIFDNQILFDMEDDLMFMVGIVME